MNRQIGEFDASASCSPVAPIASGYTGQNKTGGSDAAECAGNTNKVKDLRLLFAVDSNFPGFGGAEKQALKLASALRQRGAHVEFIAPQVFADQALEEVIDGFSLKRIAYPHIPKLGALILMARFKRYVQDNAARFDAVHVHVTHLMAAAAGFARVENKLPVITKISGFYEFEGGVLDHGQRFNPVNFLVRQGLKRVSHVQTISEQTREKLLESGFTESQIKFVPNGIEVGNTPVPSPSGQVLKIGYCGRLREVKGVHILLEGIAQFKLARPDQDIKLVIAGDGDTFDDLQNQARSLEIDKHIEWLGRIQNTAEFFQSIDIYVQPSFAEGLPNSVMEAMLESRPVLATDVGGNIDLIKDGSTGLLFPVGDAHSLSQQLVRLVEKPDLRLSLARQGREHIVQGYGFDQVVSQLVELYSVGG